MYSHQTAGCGTDCSAFFAAALLLSKWRTTGGPILPIAPRNNVHHPTRSMLRNGSTSLLAAAVLSKITDAWSILHPISGIACPTWQCLGIPLSSWSFSLHGRMLGARILPAAPVRDVYRPTRPVLQARAICRQGQQESGALLCGAYSYY